MSCPNCNTLFPGSGKYCIKCGGTLPHQSTGVQTSTQRAPVDTTSASVSSAQVSSTWSGQAGSQQSGQFALPARVIVTDFNMPFGSMVGLMVKLAIAAIPALIILMVLAALISAVLGGLLGGILF